ncbi:MAG: prepilin-type N-terminal cleavage/methylation domain-containing protein [bacterium]
MNRKNKAGFTLVELMVVAIIVAILAAVAIPLMSGNKRKAYATEAQAGLGTLRTQMSVYKAEKGGYPTVLTAILPATSTELDGTYFKTSDYSLTAGTSSNYTLQARGSTGDVNTLTVTLTDAGVWGGTLIP